MRILRNTISVTVAVTLLLALFGLVFGGTARAAFAQANGGIDLTNKVTTVGLQAETARAAAKRAG